MHARLAALTLGHKLGIICKLFDRYGCQYVCNPGSSDMQIKLLLNSTTSEIESSPLPCKKFYTEANRLYEQRSKDKPRWKPVLPVISEVNDY